MIKRWVWAMAIGLVLLGWAWNTAGGFAYDLTKLKSVCVAVEKLDPDIERHLGLSQESVTNHVYVWLKAKLPRLRVERDTGTGKGICAFPYSGLILNVNLSVGQMGTRQAYIYGWLRIQLLRSTLWETGKAGAGVAYDLTMGITGTLTSTKFVYDSLDELLTDFAAEYYKAGNP